MSKIKKRQVMAVFEKTIIDFNVINENIIYVNDFSKVAANKNQYCSSKPANCWYNVIMQFCC